MGGTLYIYHDERMTDQDNRLKTIHLSSLLLEMGRNFCSRVEVRECVRVCVCVCEREREREREKKKEDEDTVTDWLRTAVLTHNFLTTLIPDSGP